MYNQVINEDAYHICKNEKRKIISLTSKRRTNFIGNNLNGKLISILDLDKSGIEEERADYIIEVENEKLIFVELKGIDIDKAINQIDNSINILNQIVKSRVQINARIVVTKTYSPDVKSNFYKRFEKKLKGYNNINSVLVKSKKLEETI